MNAVDINHFQRQKKIRVPVFLERFAGYSFRNLKILEIGCGHGALAVALAEKGADKVVGIDLIPHRTHFARQNLQTNYPHLENHIDFQSSDIRDLKEDSFDVIVSKATFEHIFDLEALLLILQDKLKPGGRIMAGIGPLFYSPMGHHKRISPSFPWAHLLLPVRMLRKKRNKNKNRKISGFHELGLNGYSLKKYREIFYSLEGMKVENFRTNVSDKFLMKIFRLLVRIPFLREYVTYNIYCILRKKGGNV